MQKHYNICIAFQAEALFMSQPELA